MIYFCVKFQKDPLYGLNLTFFAPWLPWQRLPFWIFSTPPIAATHYGGYSHKVLCSLMKGIQKKFKSPLFCFHDNCGKVCPSDSDFFGLSRSNRCGCCSYQVSSISVWRVSCYDHFCVFFIFLAFWPFPWQRQPFWKNQPLTAQLHMAYDIPTRFHKVWSRHLREIETKMCGRRIIRIIIIVKKKRRIAIHYPGWCNKKQSKNNMSHKLRLWAIIRNGANTIIIQRKKYIWCPSSLKEIVQ